MAKIDFNEYNNYQSNGGSSKFPRVNFFSLADDGDEAIVRFPYSAPEEFDLDAVHTVKVGNAFKKVSCLRTAKEPLELCPLCAHGGESQSKVSLRFFCKLVRYIQNEQGQLVAQPCVWDRPAALSKTLKSYMDDYGDLHNMLFKIKRHGAKGNQNTTYDIQPANPAVYKPETYVADFSGFDNFDLSYFFCLKKNVDEMNAYLATGAFPEKKTQQAAAAQTFTPAAAMPFNGYDDNPANTVGAPWTPAGQPAQPATQQPTTERPRRYAY